MAGWGMIGWLSRDKEERACEVGGPAETKGGALAQSVTSAALRGIISRMGPNPADCHQNVTDRLT